MLEFGNRHGSGHSFFEKLANFSDQPRRTPTTTAGGRSTEGWVHPGPIRFHKPDATGEGGLKRITRPSRFDVAIFAFRRSSESSDARVVSIIKSVLGCRKNRAEALRRRECKKLKSEFYCSASRRLSARKQFDGRCGSHSNSRKQASLAYRYDRHLLVSQVCKLGRQAWNKSEIAQLQNAQARAGVGFPSLALRLSEYSAPSNLRE